MIKIIVLFFSLFLCFDSVKAQVLSLNESGPYHFQRNPSAAAEAMGGAYTTVDGNLFSVFYNPAGINSLKGLEVAGSFANRLYGLPDPRYYYGSAGMKIHKYLSTAFTFQRFKGDKNNTLFPGGLPAINKYTLTLGSRIFSTLDLGVNINYLDYQLSNLRAAFCFDAGAKYSMFAGNSSTIVFAADVKNIGNVNFKSSQGWQLAIPAFATLGIAYQHKNPFHGRKEFMQVLVQAEYMHNLRSAYYHTTRFGTELLLWKLLALRGGFYHRNLYDYGFPNANLNQQNVFTYGAGLFIHVNRFIKDSPLECQLDYCNLPQPALSKVIFYDQHYNIASVMLRYNLKYKEINRFPPGHVKAGVPEF